MGLQGTHQRIGEYDLASGCCLATANLASPPTNLAYSSDGKLLIALLEDRSLVAFIGQLSASMTLLPGSSRLEKKQLLYHLAVSAVRIHTAARPSDSAHSAVSASEIRRLAVIRAH